MDFIETDELLAALDSERFYILDVRSPRIPESLQKYTEAHIPGALFFDILSIRDTTVTHPLKLPTVTQFSSAMRRLRLKNDGRTIVFYDQTGMFSVGRAWWMLKYFGYTADIKVLTGGFPKWVAEGKPTVSGLQVIEGEDEDLMAYRFPLNPFMLVTIEELKNMLPGIQNGESQVQLWDCRTDDMYADGSISGNIHIPYRLLLDDHWNFKSKTEVKDILTAQGLNLNQPVVTMCKMGFLSSLTYVLLKYVGKEDVRMHAGSWLEYSAQT